MYGDVGSEMMLVSRALCLRYLCWAMPSPTAFHASPLCTSLTTNAACTQQEEDDDVEEEAPSSQTHQPSNKPFFPKKGQEIELACQSLAFKGKGVCKAVDTGFVVFCDRALPGERLVARISKKKGSYAEAIKLRTLTPHDYAVIAPCEYVADCGGCKMQNLQYDAQLQAKEQQVHELVLHVGKFSSDCDHNSSGSFLKPIVPCSAQFHYRNKMEFSFGTSEWIPKDQMMDVQLSSSSDHFALGLHVPGRFDKILSIKKCLLQDPRANIVLERVHEYCSKHISEMEPYNTLTHDGFLKHLMIRSGSDCDTGSLQLMVNFVTSSFKPDVFKPLIHELVNEIPEVVSIINNVNMSVGNTSSGEEEHILYGSPTITESLCGLTFEISANSFFQTNTKQAEVLYQLVEEAALLAGNGQEVVLDLFCGTGTIGLTLAKKVKHVYGYEVVPEAVADARRNAKRNGIANATFIQGDLNKIDRSFGNAFPYPDLVILDPNRPGIHTKLTKFLLKTRVPRIVYVSCNPATCARDLDFLCHGMPEASLAGAYNLVSVQPVDMFPHTPHIECVCSLELKQGK